MASPPSDDPRIEALIAAENRLVHDLQRCVPPVDLHRRDLERVRADLARLREEHADR